MPKLMKVETNGSLLEYAGKSTSAGSGDVGEFPVLDGNGKLDISFMPTSVGQDAVTATAGEALSAGDFVYFNGSGQVMKADADTPSKAAQGYVNASVLNGGSATVFFDDSNTGLTGLTPGAKYFLSATAGQATTTAPTTSGHIVQELGFATSATNLRVNIQTPIVRA